MCFVHVERIHFATSFSDIIKQVESIDPSKYAQSRNFLNGAVTRLSPYISRGVISTRYVFEALKNLGYDFSDMEKLVQELAWRDYWQIIWDIKGDAIEKDLKFPQSPVRTDGVPTALLRATTGINSIDDGLVELIETGYIHNHLRMYIASLACNFSMCHWEIPARWMYYHLLDGDWASNTLSWQWVAGSNSSKKYYFNQENVNKYSGSSQLHTFADVSYDAFPLASPPDALIAVEHPKLTTVLPESNLLKLDPDLPLLIYTSYQLDPLWYSNIAANRVLLLEPSHYRKYPVSEKVIQFILQLGENIKGLQVFTGEFADLASAYGKSDIRYKKHPFSRYFQGKEEPAERLTTIDKDYPSFFAYWKKAQKILEFN
ncbi:MAG: hypothetical protein RIQ47_1209 [Bacteroidota bacterium]|jgi:deoxyribodipyrimidine photo-lyase